MILYLVTKRNNVTLIIKNLICRSEYNINTLSNITIIINFVGEFEIKNDFTKLSLIT